MVKDWLRDSPDAFLECRDTSLHHSWRAANAWRVKGGFGRVLMCDRCDAEKVQELDLTGTVLKTRMSYPDGYLKPKGSGRATSAENADMRAELMRRLVRR